MTTLTKHLVAMFEVDGGTLAIIVAIACVAVFMMRNHLANILTVILIFPLMLLLSIVAHYIVLVSGLYDPKKLADWLIWTITSATVGTMAGLAIVALTAMMWERRPAG